MTQLQAPIDMIDNIMDVPELEEWDLSELFLDNDLWLTLQNEQVRGNYNADEQL